MSNYGKQIARLEQEYKLAKRRAKEAKQALLDADASLDIHLDSQELVRAIVVNTQERAHTAIAEPITRCLQTCFDYEFKLIFEEKRNQTEVRAVFLKDGHEHDPQEMSGGGAGDLAAFACRVVSVVLGVQGSRPFLVLDEPLKFLSRRDKQAQKNLPRVRALIEALAQELGVQFLIVTHIDKLNLGKVVEL